MGDRRAAGQRPRQASTATLAVLWRRTSGCCCAAQAPQQAAATSASVITASLLHQPPSAPHLEQLLERPALAAHRQLDVAAEGEVAAPRQPNVAGGLGEVGVGEELRHPPRLLRSGLTAQQTAPAALPAGKPGPQLPRQGHGVRVSWGWWVGVGCAPGGCQARFRILGNNDGSVQGRRVAWSRGRVLNGSMLSRRPSIGAHLTVPQWSVWLKAPAPGPNRRALVSRVGTPASLTHAKAVEYR